MGVCVVFIVSKSELTPPFTFRRYSLRVASRGVLLWRHLDRQAITLGDLVDISITE